MYKRIISGSAKLTFSLLITWPYIEYDSDQLLNKSVISTLNLLFAMINIDKTTIGWTLFINELEDSLAHLSQLVEQLKIDSE